MSKSCNSCYFYDKCDGSRVCEYYCQIGLEEDIDVDKLVEKYRNEYREAWFDYINDNYN